MAASFITPPGRVGKISCTWTSHWRLEYPVGKVLFDSINWISNPKISPDGRLVAIADHENPDGDDEGSVAIIDLQGHEKKLSSDWTSVEGILWSPAGDEIWFSATNSGSSENLGAATLSGKVRTIANLPGGMWFQDLSQRRGPHGHPSAAPQYPRSAARRK